MILETRQNWEEGGKDPVLVQRKGGCDQKVQEEEVEGAAGREL